MMNKKQLNQLKDIAYSEAHFRAASMSKTELADAWAEEKIQNEVKEKCINEIEAKLPKTDKLLWFVFGLRKVIIAIIEIIKHYKLFFGK